MSVTSPGDAGQIVAEFRLPTQDVRDDIPFFTKVLGMRMDMIFPADDPRVAVFSGHGVRLRIEKGAAEAPGTLRLLAPDPDALAGGQRVLMAPNGTRIEIAALNPPLEIPHTVHDFAVRRLAEGAPWVVGRAGMQYRDLVPSRLGGSMIASHIRIPDGGPVPDMVHYHTVGFQLIFCIHGWVDLVYEDQGPPFRLVAGNCVIQPPRIRHRVLHASDDLQVIEIGVPAEHLTTIDHEMTLPNGPANPGRVFDGQRFVHHRAEEAVWTPFRIPGLEARDTTISAHTDGVAGVQVIRRGSGTVPATRHNGNILFSYLMQGAMTLQAQGHDPAFLSPGDAFVIPPGLTTRYADTTADLSLMEVTLPAVFDTEILDWPEGA
jgi:quercetin dioxygenase-like cupin family protein